MYLHRKKDVSHLFEKFEIVRLHLKQKIIFHRVGSITFIDFENTIYLIEGEGVRVRVGG